MAFNAFENKESHKTHTVYKMVGFLFKSQYFENHLETVGDFCVPMYCRTAV